MRCALCKNLDVNAIATASFEIFFKHNSSAQFFLYFNSTHQSVWKCERNNIIVHVLALLTSSNHSNIFAQRKRNCKCVHRFATHRSKEGLWIVTQIFNEAFDRIRLSSVGNSKLLQRQKIKNACCFNVFLHQRVQSS